MERHAKGVWLVSHWKTLLCFWKTPETCFLILTKIWNLKIQRAIDIRDTALQCLSFDQYEAVIFPSVILLKTTCVTLLKTHFENLYLEVGWSWKERISINYFKAFLGLYKKDWLPARKIEVWVGGGLSHMQDRRGAKK